MDSSRKRIGKAKSAPVSAKGSENCKSLPEVEGVTPQYKTKENIVAAA